MSCIRGGPVQPLTNTLPALYLQGDWGEMHMRPIPGKPDQWLCELCALTTTPDCCNMAWDLDHPTPAMFLCSTAHVPCGEDCNKPGWTPEHYLQYQMQQRWGLQCSTCLHHHYHMLGGEAGAAGDGGGGVAPQALGATHEDGSGTSAASASADSNGAKTAAAVGTAATAAAAGGKGEEPEGGRGMAREPAGANVEGEGSQVRPPTATAAKAGPAAAPAAAKPSSTAVKKPAPAAAAKALPAAAAAKATPASQPAAAKPSPAASKAPAAAAVAKTSAPSGTAPAAAVASSVFSAKAAPASKPSPLPAAASAAAAPAPAEEKSASGPAKPAAPASKAAAASALATEPKGPAAAAAPSAAPAATKAPAATAAAAAAANSALPSAFAAAAAAEMKSAVSVPVLKKQGSFGAPPRSTSDVGAIPGRVARAAPQAATSLYSSSSSSSFPGASGKPGVELDFLGGPKKQSGESTAAWIQRRAEYRKQQLKGVLYSSSSTQPQLSGGYNSRADSMSSAPSFGPESDAGSLPSASSSQISSGELSQSQLPSQTPIGIEQRIAEGSDDIELDFLGGPKQRPGESVRSFIKRRAEFRKQQLKGVFSGSSSSSSKGKTADSLARKSSEPGALASSASGGSELEAVKSKSSFSKAPSVAAKPQLEMCLCCQKKHFVTSEHPDKSIKPVESYLHGSGLYHMIQRDSDGLWICEWCSHYPCIRCSKLKEDLLQPVPGLWAKGQYECVPRCEKKGKGGFEGITEAVHGRAEAFERVHCHACRDLLMNGRVPGGQGSTKMATGGGGGAGNKRNAAVVPAIQLVTGLVGVTVSTLIKAAI